ncbi:MAG: hypothetical protein WC222_05460 [Parachlamydiales bacterium]|jgi:hypothetical protein
MDKTIALFVGVCCLFVIFLFYTYSGEEQPIPASIHISDSR